MEEFDAMEALKEAYNKERDLRLSIEADCDMLALENVRLTKEVSKLKAMLGSSTFQDDSTAAGITTSKSAYDESMAILSVKKDGDGLYANHATQHIARACGDKNVLSVGFMTESTINHADDSHHHAISSLDRDIVVCGGVDGYVSLYDAKDHLLIRIIHTGAPVLSLSIHGTRIAASMMDGSISMIDWSRCQGDNSVDEQHYHHKIKEHSKYVVAIKWSHDGELLATASYDKTVNLYRVFSEDGAQRLVLLTSLKFSLTPESIEFYHDEHHDYPQLIIALRDTYNLIYVNCNEPYDQQLVSMNEADWDTHTSFSALNIALSPDQKILAIANDKHAIILMDAVTKTRLQLLVGHNCGEYGKPKLAWDQSGCYLYVNSDGEHAIYVYSLFKGRVIETLAGHGGLVKDIVRHKSKRMIATASFDHSIIVWDRKLI